ncbi:MAG: hypothetical protein KGQ36_07150 [Rickettsiales bacterium]|nr:hypothetical protein [Rickettsiales bacterium]
MTKFLKSLRPLENSSFRRALSSLISKDICITDLPQELRDTKALIYSPKTNNFIASEKNQLNGYRVVEGLVKSSQDLIKLYAESKKDIRANKIHSSSYPVENLIEKFDDDSYSKFVEKLHPTAAEILRLRKEKENIRYYNSSIPRSDLGLTGKDYDDAVRNLSRAMHFLPFLENIGNYREKQELLNNFLPSSSSDPIKSLNQYLKTPYASLSFFRRIGNMQPHLIKTLHDFVYEGIVDENKPDKDKVDKELYGKRISEVPIATSLNSDVHNALKYFMNFCYGNDFFTKKAKQAMFDAIVDGSENWIKNEKAISSENFESSIDEYLSSAATQLILPSYIEKFNERVNTINQTKFFISDKKEYFPDKYEHWLVKYAIKEITSFLQDSLIKDTPERIYENAKEYENRASKINASRPLYMERLKKMEESQQTNFEWSKAFEDCEIDGVKFRCLVNELELKKETDHLHHCTSGYGPRCRAGIRHIVSGTVEETGERFTLRFSSEGNNKFKNDETVTENDKGKRKELSKKANEAIQILCKKIESKEITLNPVFGNLNKDFTISDAIGFDLTSKTQQEDLFQAYNAHPILPTTATSLENFKEEIGLESFLNKVLDEHIKLLSENGKAPPPKVAKAIGYGLKGPRESCGSLDRCD